MVKSRVSCSIARPDVPCHVVLLCPNEWSYIQTFSPPCSAIIVIFVPNRRWGPRAGVNEPKTLANEQMYLMTHILTGRQRDSRQTEDRANQLTRRSSFSVQYSRVVVVVVVVFNKNRQTAVTTSEIEMPQTGPYSLYSLRQQLPSSYFLPGYVNSSYPYTLVHAITLNCCNHTTSTTMRTQFSSHWDWSAKECNTSAWRLVSHHCPQAAAYGRTNQVTRPWRPSWKKSAFQRFKQTKFGLLIAFKSIL